MALGKMFEKTIKLVGTVSKVGVQLGADIVGTVAEKIDDDHEIKLRISEYGVKKGQYIKAITTEVAGKSSEIVDRAVDNSINALKIGSVIIKNGINQVAEGIDSSIKGMNSYNNHTMDNSGNKNHCDSTQNQPDKTESISMEHKRNVLKEEKYSDVKSKDIGYEAVMNSVILIAQKNVSFLKFVSQIEGHNLKFLLENYYQRLKISNKLDYANLGENGCIEFAGALLLLIYSYAKNDTTTINACNQALIMAFKGASPGMFSNVMDDIINEETTIPYADWSAVYRYLKDNYGTWIIKIEFASDYTMRDHFRYSKFMDGETENEASVTSKKGRNGLSYGTNIQITKVNIESNINSNQVENNLYKHSVAFEEVEIKDKNEKVIQNNNEYITENIKMNNEIINKATLISQEQAFNVLEKRLEKATETIVKGGQSYITKIMNAPDNEVYTEIFNALGGIRSSLTLKAFNSTKGFFGKKTPDATIVAKAVATVEVEEELKAIVDEVVDEATDKNKVWAKIRALAVLVFKKTIAVPKGVLAFTFDNTTVLGTAVGKIAYDTAREFIFGSKVKSNEALNDATFNKTKEQLDKELQAKRESYFQDEEMVRLRNNLFEARKKAEAEEREKFKKSLGLDDEFLNALKSLREEQKE